MKLLAYSHIDTTNALMLKAFQNSSLTNNKMDYYSESIAEKDALNVLEKKIMGNAIKQLTEMYQVGGLIA